MKNKLKFIVNEKGNELQWIADGTALKTTKGADFWRLMADDSYFIEMSVKSSEQDGTVTVKDNITTIYYPKLKTDSGRILDMSLTLTITEENDRLVFKNKIENRDIARANELEYPYIDLNKVAGERKNDILYRPHGLGERIVNPWEALESAHSEYMSSDYKEIKSTILYPRPATMSWLGIESDGMFLYVGKHDERNRACCLMNAIQPREDVENRLVSTICQYPFVRQGETIECAPVIVAFGEGSWKDGSDIYGEYARGSFYHPVEPKPWVRKMTGWQRIILRHQFGDIFWKYEDLPRLYLEGKKYGLNTLLVFGWWRGRFDNGYPHYEVDEELGGEVALRDAIAEVKRLGGYVILYNNGILIDKKSDFYREHRNEAARIDIDGNEYEDHYKFEDNGTVLRNYGYKSFVDACQATDIWLETLKKNGEMKISFDPNSIFYDQIGGRSKLCFNPEHKHGYRPDDEMVYRRQNLKELRAICKGDIAIGTECVNDGAIGEVDYIHGCDSGAFYRAKKNSPVKNIFPQMFLRTFPEPIISNRFIHDCRIGFREDLNHAFMNGFRFDVAIYRCRKDTIGALPEYAEQIAKIMKLKEQYAEFFYFGGKYVCDTELSLPQGVKYCEYVHAEKRMFALWNDSKAPVSFELFGKTIEMDIDGIDCIVK